MIKRIYQYIIPQKMRERLYYSILFPLKDRKSAAKRQEFYSTIISKGDLYFDVGANVGNRISPMLKIGTKVVAVEPQESCISVLKRKFGKKIILIPKGLGAQEDVKDFYVSNVSTVSTFSSEFIEKTRESRFKGCHWATPVKIEITTLDKLISAYGEPSFVKIDVEGFESEVLEGLSKPVHMICFEYAVPELSNKLEDCLSRLIEISPDFVFNYSEGETMEFAQDKWLTKDDIFGVVRSEAFVKGRFGDIYAKHPQKV